MSKCGAGVRGRPMSKVQATSSKACAERRRGIESTTVGAVTHDHATRSVAVFIGRRRRPVSHLLSKDAGGAARQVPRIKFEVRIDSWRRCRCAKFQMIEWSNIKHESVQRRHARPCNAKRFSRSVSVEAKSSAGDLVGENCGPGNPDESLNVRADLNC